MADLEKVIKGLECAIGIRGMKNCDDCPYEDDFNCLGCDVLLLRDALELLKEQMPRVMTLDEVHKLQSLRDGAIWLEVGKGMFPALPEMAMPELMFFIAIPPTNYKTYCEWEWYNKTWRCWTARPTDEQRKATPWDEPPKEGDSE